MQKLVDNQQILNSVMDKQNFTIKGVSKAGNRQFLQYYIDNDKLSQMLPIQIILNSIFDRQTASICIKSDSFSDYSGDVSISTQNGSNVLSATDNNIIIGDADSSVTVICDDLLLNGNSINTPNGLVTLNSNGKIDRSFIELQYDPIHLQPVQNLYSLTANTVLFTIQDETGDYKSVSLQQLYEFFSPQLQVIP